MRLNDKKRKRVPEATLSNLEDHLFLLRFFIFIMLRTLCSEVMEAKPTIFFFLNLALVWVLIYLVT